MSRRKQAPLGEHQQSGARLFEPDDLETPTPKGSSLRFESSYA